MTDAPVGSIAEKSLHPGELFTSVMSWQATPQVQDACPGLDQEYLPCEVTFESTEALF